MPRNDALASTSRAKASQAGLSRQGPPCLSPMSVLTRVFSIEQAPGILQQKPLASAVCPSCSMAKLWEPFRWIARKQILHLCSFWKLWLLFWHMRPWSGKVGWTRNFLPPNGRPALSVPRVKWKMCISSFIRSQIPQPQFSSRVSQEQGKASVPMPCTRRVPEPRGRLFP